MYSLVPNKRPKKIQLIFVGFFKYLSNFIPTRHEGVKFVEKTIFWNVYSYYLLPVYCPFTAYIVNQNRQTPPLGIFYFPIPRLKTPRLLGFFFMHKGLVFLWKAHCVKYTSIRVSLTRIFPYKNRIYDFILIRENADHGKPTFWNISRSGCRDFL